MIKDKESTLKITTDEIEKKFGKGAIMRLGESTALNVGYRRSAEGAHRRDLWP